MFCLCLNVHFYSFKHIKILCEFLRDHHLTVQSKDFCSSVVQWRFTGQVARNGACLLFSWNWSHVCEWYKYKFCKCQQHLLERESGPYTQMKMCCPISACTAGRYIPGWTFSCQGSSWIKFLWLSYKPLNNCFCNRNIERPSSLWPGTAIILQALGIWNNSV